MGLDASSDVWPSAEGEIRTPEDFRPPDLESGALSGLGYLGMGASGM